VSRPSSRIGAVLLTLVLAVPAWGARPLDTEDAGTLDPGAFELEVSADYAREPGQDVWVARGVLAAGLLPRLEARIELPLAVVDPDAGGRVAGVADGLVGAKYRLVDEGPHLPALLAGVGVVLPFGDAGRGLGGDSVDVVALGVIGKTLGPVTLHGNVGYTFVTADRGLDAWIVAASAEYRVTPALSVVAEGLGFLGPGADTGRARAGVAYTVREGVRLDAAIGHGFGGGSPGVLATVGVTFGF
jgi:hypothetical protein